MVSPGGLSSGWSLIRVVSLGLSSGWSLWASRQGGLSGSLIRVVSPGFIRMVSPGGLSGPLIRWSFWASDQGGLSGPVIRMVSQGLSSGWSLRAFYQGGLLISEREISVS